MTDTQMQKFGEEGRLSFKGSSRCAAKWVKVVVKQNEGLYEMKGIKVKAEGKKAGKGLARR